MRKILIIIFLMILLIMVKVVLGFAQQGEVKVIVRQVGDSNFFYKVSNFSDKPIVKIMVGYNYNRESEEGEGNELLIEPIGIEAPSGWKGSTVFLEESNYLHIRWSILEQASAISPSGSLDGFIVQMPQSYDLMKQASFSVIYNDGTVTSSKIELDPTPPILYDGKGQKHSDVNTFLSYLRPLQARTTLSDGKNYYYIFLFYGQTIMPETFKAELNGKDITNSFHPKAGESDAVKLNFKKGKNTLALIIDGKKSNGKRKTDIDRFVFIVQ